MLVILSMLTYHLIMVLRAKQSLDELKMSDFKAFLASESDESDLEEDLVPQQLAFEVDMPAGIEDTAAAQWPSEKRIVPTTEQREKINQDKRDKYKSLLGFLEESGDEEQQDMEVFCRVIVF